MGAIWYRRGCLWFFTPRDDAWLYLRQSCSRVPLVGLLSCAGTRSCGFAMRLELSETFEEEGAYLRGTRHHRSCCEGDIAPYGKVGARDEILLRAHVGCHDGGGDDDKTKTEEDAEG